MTAVAAKSLSPRAGPASPSPPLAPSTMSATSSAESYTGGPLDGLSVTNGFDQFFRRTNLVVKQSGTPLVRQSFGYDGASRLRTVTDNSSATPYSATYSYLYNSPTRRPDWLYEQQLGPNDHHEAIRLPESPDANLIRAITVL